MSKEDKPGKRNRRRARANTDTTPAANPAPPGMSSGRYKPLTDHDVTQIHTATLDVLEQLGMANPSDEWRERVVGAGGWMSGDGRLHFPRAMVEDAIAKNGPQFCVTRTRPKTRH
tara:strand:- start:147 stop:491 length:345 start_codon:yes stop_codon:yes gene_type:complete